MKIVVIEDEIRIREGLVKLIRRLDADYEVVGEGANGQEGLELVCRTQPDIIITDIRMPLTDGLEMLTLLEEKGIRKKTIVLSAYSEFEYARQAMRMGVKEYLLKPIVVSDISEALRRTAEEVRQEKRQSEPLFEDAAQIFSGILAGTVKADEKLKRRLSEQFGISEKTRYYGICLYLGSRYEEEQERAGKDLSDLFSSRKDLEFLILNVERERSVLVLAYQVKNAGELERWVQYWLLQDRSRKVLGAVGFIPEMELANVQKGLTTLLSHMDWSISLGDDVMISYPKVTKLQTSPCVYPLEAESRMKVAVCTGEREKIRKSLAEFRDSFSTGKIYDPRDMKECYVRFLWAFMNTGKEVGLLDYESLEQQKILEQIMGARTSGELEMVGNFLMGKLQDGREEATHLMVKRAQSMIHEFYQTGITLEEIAAKLDITPEYLGTRFRQEMGMTFSAYIKNYRMTKARELLIGTNLKLYEIAEKLGYSEPKYFSRVFKEETGQLPADYRKTHK